MHLIYDFFSTWRFCKTSKAILYGPPLHILDHNNYIVKEVIIIYQLYQAKTITLNTIQAKPLKYNSCATEIRASAPASNAEDTITKYELPKR